jgi:uncharacterized OsmC-like protein
MDQSTVTVTMDQGYYTTAKSGKHEWHADLPEDNGGDNNAPTPEELVMGTLGSCMAQTAKLYAARKGWQIDRVEIKLNFERFRASDYDGYDGDAAFVHEVREAITVEGSELDDDQKKRIIDIMGKCPIRRLIQNPAFFVEMAAENS